MAGGKRGESAQNPFRNAGIEIGHHVLAVGFRDGAELRGISERVGPTRGVSRIDVNPEHVDAVRRDITRQALSGVSADRGRVLDIPFGDSTSDVVFCKGVLQEVRRLKRTLEEMARVCRPGGILCIVDIKQFSRLRLEAYRARAWLRGRREPAIRGKEALNEPR